MSVIKTTNLTRKFGSITAVNDLNIEIPEGEIFGLVGPDGAGKTTTMRLLTGILDPTSGEGWVYGKHIQKEAETLKDNIAYMSQRFGLYEDLTVGENIDFYAGVYGIAGQKALARKDEVPALTGIERYLDRRAGQLSGGWKQRLALGCAIIHEPRIIFLDEPTSGVDPITRNNFWNIIKGMAKEGITVFVTTHYMDEAENCNRMTMIYKGNIIAMGTPEEMKTKFMVNDVIQILVPEAEVWMERLRKEPFVKEAALFGSSIA